MPRHDDEDNAEDIEGWEDPDESDQDSHDDPEMVPCPYCKKLISEDTDICHLCGSYILNEDSRAPVPMWIIVGVVICILLTLVGVAMMW
jgi:hypothetical protein